MEKEIIEKKFRGTKGTWQVVDDYDKYIDYSPKTPQIYIWDGDEQSHGPVCDMGQIGDMNYAESLANATLIAAAPDLLQVLKYIVQHDDGVGICLGYKSREMAEAAINKALNL